MAPYVKDAMRFQLKKTEKVPPVMRGCSFWNMLYDYQKQAVLWCIHTHDRLEANEASKTQDKVFKELQRMAKNTSNG